MVFILPINSVNSVVTGTTAIAGQVMKAGNSNITGSTALFEINGNVGIGTTTPTARFDLAGDYKEGVVTANTSTSYTINLASGTVQILTLTGTPCVFTFPTATAGQSFLMVLKQDGSGAKTVTWPSVTNPVKWPGNTAPTITSTASKADLYAFTADGTQWFGRTLGQNYL